jgi:hypothetical protein
MPSKPNTTATDLADTVMMDNRKIGRVYSTSNAKAAE